MELLATETYSLGTIVAVVTPILAAICTALSHLYWTLQKAQERALQLVIDERKLVDTKLETAQRENKETIGVVLDLSKEVSALTGYNQSSQEVQAKIDNLRQSVDEKLENMHKDVLDVVRDDNTTD